MAYFKLVATNNNKEDWMLQEFLEGRARYGWSGKDCDLIILDNKDKSKLNDIQKKSWHYTQFLVKRIEIGDRIVIQHKQPLREFLIGEVIGKYQFDKKPKSDFNHIIPVKPLCNEYIDINSKIIPSYLKKALTKRGQYYEIYPDDAIIKLDEIIKQSLWLSDEYKIDRKLNDDLTDAHEDVLRSVVLSIRKYWKGTDFEKFIATLFNMIPGIEVKSQGDSGKGWDLLLQITDPITLEVLHENVPVQCKTYKGLVSSNKPINDITRALINSKSQLGYIAILGDISKDFEINLINALDKLNKKDKPIYDIRVVNETTIAELALKYRLFTSVDDNR